ncbi:MAG: response regulator [Bacteroidetes bacterium]|nr:response regulator [Bacteroidota bacterium]
MKTQAAEKRAAIPPPFSLWIVDDDATLVELLGDSLSADRRLSHVRTFTSPKEFLDAFRSCVALPDVVALDIRMHQMNGLALLRKIRSLSHRTRIVMCSALNDTHTLLDALADGASGFLVKPATAEELVSAAVHAVAGLRPLNAAASTTLVGYITPPPPTAIRDPRSQRPHTATSADHRASARRT